MAEFIRPGMIASCGAEARARRLWAHAMSAVRLGGPQPFSTLEAPLSAKSILAFLLKCAGLPKDQMARRLRVSEIGVTSLLIRVRHARRDPLVAAWLDGLAASMPDFNSIDEAA